MRNVSKLQQVSAAALIAASTMICAPAHAEKIEGIEDKARTGDIVFSMDRKGKEIGAHSLSFERLADETIQVDVAINIKVKFGFIVAYRYEHLNREIWSADGQTLLSFDAQTFKNGDWVAASAKRADGALQVTDETGASYALETPAVTTSYWNPALLTGEAAVINTQKGTVSDVVFAADGDTPQIDVPSSAAVVTTQFQSSGDLAGITAQYADDATCWVGLSFIPKNQDVPISYSLEQYFPVAKPDLAGISGIGNCAKLSQTNAALQADALGANSQQADARGR